MLEEHFLWVFLAINTWLATTSMLLWILVVTSSRQFYCRYSIVVIFAILCWIELVFGAKKFPEELYSRVWFAVVYYVSPLFTLKWGIDLAVEISRKMRNTSVKFSNLSSRQRFAYILNVIFLLVIGLYAGLAYSSAFRCVVPGSNSIRAESQPASQSLTQPTTQPKNENGGGEKK